MRIKIRKNVMMISKRGNLPLYQAPTKSWGRKALIVMDFFLKTIFRPQLLIGACDKGKLPLFEISVILDFFYISIPTYLKKKKNVVGLIIVTFSFLAPKNSFPLRKA
jgi:hypothetical protein